MYITICKWMTSASWCRKKGTQNWRSGTTPRGSVGRNMGGGFRLEGTHVYLWAIHVDVWQKPSQYPSIKFINKNSAANNRCSINTYRMNGWMNVHFSGTKCMSDTGPLQIVMKFIARFKTEGNRRIYNDHQRLFLSWKTLQRQDLSFSRQENLV